MDDHSWDVDRFTAGLRERLARAMGAARDAAALATAVKASAEAAEEPCSGRAMACSAGCPYCCCLNVAILLPEAMIIAEWMRERLSPSALLSMQESLADHRSRIRWVDDDERIAKKIRCPLLNEKGACTIHPVRPLVCRGAASLDRQSCEEAFSPVITDEARLVVADLLRQAAFDAAFTTLAETLKSHGLDDRSIELGAGVLAFLQHPEYREELVAGRRLDDALWL